MLLKRFLKIFKNPNIRKYFSIALFFLLVRLVTIYVYQDTYYYYGCVCTQFAIAEAAFNNHSNSWDKVLANDVAKNKAQNTVGDRFKYIPIENWRDCNKSGVYTTFPAVDLPGFGYLIAFTSKLFGDTLTSKYAFIIQILLEIVSLLLFIYCVSIFFGGRTAFIASLIYIFAYPFIWPIASQPMRDIFVMGIYSLYMAAFFIFIKRNSLLSYLLIIFLISLSALLLWVRPSGYYFFFTVSPLVFLVRQKTIKNRVIIFLCTIIIPILIFGIPLKQFNKKYYGVTDTDIMGRALWEGMGILGYNSYGFVLDDSALVPWAKKQGYDYAYASPELNKLLGDYARKVIKEDPRFYFETVKKRVLDIYSGPLAFILPSGLGWNNVRYGRWFFRIGLILSLFMIAISKNKRILLIILLMPLFYTLLTQIPLHFEPRYLATGAWVLILPFAWVFDQLIELTKRIKLKCAG